MNKRLTVNVAGYDVTVHGDYQAAEQQTREYPGCSASFDFEFFSFVDDEDRTVYSTDTDHEMVGRISEEIEDAVLEAISDAEYAARCDYDEREHDDYLANRITDADLARWEPDTGPHF